MPRRSARTSRSRGNSMRPGIQSSSGPIGAWKEGNAGSAMARAGAVTFRQLGEFGIPYDSCYLGNPERMFISMPKPSVH